MRKVPWASGLFLAAILIAVGSAAKAQSSPFAPASHTPYFGSYFGDYFGPSSVPSTRYDLRVPPLSPVQPVSPYVPMPAHVYRPSPDYAPAPKSHPYHAAPAGTWDWRRSPAWTSDWHRYGW